MNIDEAIMHLREMLKKRVEKMLNSEAKNNPQAKNDYIALNYAVTALEKQIPKKVKKQACPSCGSYNLYNDCERELCYCGNCGQKLDWSGSCDSR